MERSLNYLKIRNKFLYHIVHAEMGDDVDMTILKKAAREYVSYTDELIYEYKSLIYEDYSQIERPIIGSSVEGSRSAEEVRAEQKEKLKYYTEESNKLEDRYNTILKSTSEKDFVRAGDAHYYRS